MAKRISITLKKLIMTILAEHKAENCVAIDVSKKTDITDFMIIATGTSAPHLKALASIIYQQTKAEGFNPISLSGVPDSGWVLIDFGYCVVHLMVQRTREFYSLDQHWQPGK